MFGLSINSPLDNPPAGPDWIVASSGTTVHGEAGTKHPGDALVVVSVNSQRDYSTLSGARDLRLFRDGQLVRFQEGDLKDSEYLFW